jgi:hypothetical protein
MKDKLAMKMAREVLRAIKNCIHPAEREEAYQIFYEICLQGVKAYHSKQTEKMLKPSQN